MDHGSTVEDCAEKLWDYHRLGQEITPCDVIVGLGSYDLRVADRCAELWHQGLSPLVVFSGARGNWTEHLTSTEAQLFSDRAISLGLPRAAVLQEDRSTNIGENLDLTLKMLTKRDRPPHKLLMVTKPNTERRAWATAKKLFPHLSWAVTSPHTHWQGPYPEGRSFPDLVHEMVGDLQRILLYPQKGFQIVQEIPPPVLEAYNLLIKEGFTRHLIGSQT